MDIKESALRRLVAEELLARIDGYSSRCLGDLANALRVWDEGWATGRVTPEQFLASIAAIAVSGVSAANIVADLLEVLLVSQGYFDVQIDIQRRAGDSRFEGVTRVADRQSQSHRALEP